MLVQHNIATLHWKMELLSVYYVVYCELRFSVFIKKLAVTFFIKEIFTKIRIINILLSDVNLIIYISPS